MSQYKLMGVSEDQHKTCAAYGHGADDNADTG
jgi:hypothetical protein